MSRLTDRQLAIASTGAVVSMVVLALIAAACSSAGNRAAAFGIAVVAFVEGLVAIALLGLVLDRLIDAVAELRAGLAELRRERERERLGSEDGSQT